MAKKITAIIAAILVMIFALCACESFSAKKVEGGDPTAKVENNGSFVVKQGGYIYFVNGASAGFSEAEANYFGNVTKGGIVRATVSENGSLSDFKMIVPKQVSSMGAGAISIFGEWIYYVSSTTKTDNKGVLNTDEYMFYRTKIDGTGTQLIKIVQGSSITYKFTETALVYYVNSSLYTVVYKNKMNDESATLISDSVSGVLFTQTANYDPQGAYPLSNYVFYAKSVTNEDGVSQNYNEVYAVKADGTENKLLIGKTAYSENPTERETFNITLKTSVEESDGSVTVYYSKSYTVGDTSTVKGLFAYKFDSNLTFTASGEKELLPTATDVSKVYPISYAAGAIVYDSALVLVNGTKTTANTGSITPIKIIKENNDAGQEGYYLYYLRESAIYKLLIMNSDLSFTTAENEKQILPEGISADFTSPVILGGKLYYISSSDNTYVHIFDMARYKEYSASDENQDIDVFVGIIDESAEANEETSA